MAGTMIRRKFLIRSKEFDLFDLELNPAEKNNLFNGQPENVLRLNKLLHNWERDEF